MRISELIKSLEQVKAQHGDIECVQLAEDFKGNTIYSTIENLKVVPVSFGEHKAVRLDWRI